MQFKSRVLKPDVSLIASIPRIAAIPRKKQEWGRNKVYMPSFAVIMHRTPALGPQWAKFSVPLWFSKLDLRDYLYHVYNTSVHGIRSYVQLGQVVQGRQPPGPNKFIRPQRNRWHRKRSKKRMTVELEQPFVWPKQAPTIRKDFDQDHHLQRKAENKERQDQQTTMKDTLIDKDDRELIREQFDMLKSGKTIWQAPQGEGPSITR